LPAWEEWANDALEVLDEVGSERAAVLGQADGGPVAVLFAAAYPDRAQALIVANAWVRSAEDLVYHSLHQLERDALEDVLVSTWGTESFADLGFQPDSAGDPEYRKWIAKSTRLSSSPREAAAYMQHIAGIDIRHALPTIQVPTLVIQRMDMPLLPLEAGQQLAEGIQKALFVQVEGSDFSIFTEPNTRYSIRLRSS
jgi:pimeloyl-ACP methyl ester carboxylesterase